MSELSWRKMKGLVKNKIRDVFAIISYKSFVFSHCFEVMTSEETIQKIISENLSVARFGDGEFKWILRVEQDSFQEDDANLTKRLEQILKADCQNCLVCVPRFFSNDKNYSRTVRKYWHNFIRWHGCRIATFLSDRKIYGDAYFTRWYRGNNSKKTDYSKIVKQLRMIWDKRDIVIIEGELTRFGVGNSLLDNAKSVERIVAPSKNAFSYHDEILEYAKRNCKNKLVLIALGPTATVLAYDLSQFGTQAIDIGHLDIEYEWYLREAHEQKILIPGKYVNEAGGIFEEMPDKKALKDYKKQIVVRIGVKNEKN